MTGALNDLWGSLLLIIHITKLKDSNMKVEKLSTIHFLCSRLNIGTLYGIVILII
jgi:hypothetical protein